MALVICSATSARRRTRAPRRVAVAAALLVGALAITACAGSSGGHGSARASADTVTIAVQGPMSGPQADIGEDMLRGAQLAASDLNARGGVLGQRVVVTAADDAADPAKGAPVAHRIVGRDIAGVVGPFDSSVGAKALPVYRAAGIPTVRLTSAASTEGFGITTQPMQGQIAPVEARALTQLLRAPSVAVLYDPSTFTAGVAHQLRDLLTTARVAVPVFRSVSPAGSPRDEAHRVTEAVDAAAAAHPAVTYLAMYGRQAGKAAAAMATRPAAGRCFVDLAAQGFEFTVTAGEAGTACLASGVPPPDQLPRGEEYVARYEKTFEAVPGIWGPFAHDAVQALAQAARRAGRWTHRAVRSELGHTDDRAGMTGRVKVTMPSGNRLDPPVVVLDVTPGGVYRVDPDWAAAVGYPIP